MKLTVHPGRPLRGEVRLPGDKSLSHRAVLFAAMAEGESHIHNFLVSGVTKVMLDSLARMGVEWKLSGDELTVHGKGLQAWCTPDEPLYCGNSATTIRFLAGAVAAAGIPAVLDGSSGLRRRPMDRIIEPLRQMNVSVDAAEGSVAPLQFHGRDPGTRLVPLVAVLPVASAQVKTCLLLAALAANGETVLVEPGPSRDHSERMLRSMGVSITNREIHADGCVRYETRVQPSGAALNPIQMTLPGDISAAAFLIAGGLITPESEIKIPGVGLNPTRTGIIDALKKMGADIEVSNVSDQAGEPAGDLVVRYSKLSGTQINGALVVRMIDEFSVFGVAAAYGHGPSTVRDAEELRYKESDRIATLVEEMARVGVSLQEAKDGFLVPGERKPAGGTVQAHGDHRLAMAMAVLGLASERPVTVLGAEMIHESFPEFTACLQALGAELEMSEGVAGVS